MTSLRSATRARTFARACARSWRSASRNGPDAELFPRGAAFLPFLILVAVTREWPLLVGVVIVSTVAAIFAVARLVVDVSVEEITVSFHFLWPTRRIRVADVKRAHASTYNSLLEYGGYGVRLGPRGWAFNTGGDEGVLIEMKDGKRVMIGSRRPHELEAAIARAVAAHAPSTGVASPV